MSADRNAVGKARDFNAERLEQARDIHRGRFALGVRIGREDDLLGALVGDALHQLADADVIRADMTHRRERAVKHMVQAAVLLCALEGDHVARVCHDADGLLVARLVRADRALLAVREVLTAFAGEGLFLRLTDGAREALRVLLWHIEHMERQTLRALLTDAGQPGELLDQPLDRWCEVIHYSRPPRPPPRPPVSADIWLCDFSVAALSASLTAATTRS